MSKEDKVGGSSAKMPAVLTPMELARSPGVSKIFILTPAMLQKLGLAGHMTARIASRDVAKKVESPSTSQGSDEKSNVNSTKPNNMIKLVVQPTAGSSKRKRDSTSEKNTEKTSETLKSCIPKQLEQRLILSNSKLTEDNESFEDNTCSTPKTKKRRRKLNTSDVQPQNMNNENTIESKDELNKSTPGLRTSKRVIKFKKFDDYIRTDDILSFGEGSSNSRGKVKQRRSSIKLKNTDSIEQPQSTISNNDITDVNSIDIVELHEKKNNSKKSVNKVNQKQKYLEVKRRVSFEDINFKVPETHNDCSNNKSVKMYGKAKPKEKQPVVHVAQSVKGKSQGETNAIASNSEISEIKKSKNFENLVVTESPTNSSQIKLHHTESSDKFVERKIFLNKHETASRLEIYESRDNLSSERISKEKLMMDSIEPNHATNSREQIDSSTLKISKPTGSSSAEKISGTVKRREVPKVYRKELNKSFEREIKITPNINDLTHETISNEIIKTIEFKQKNMVEEKNIFIEKINISDSQIIVNAIKKQSEVEAVKKQEVKNKINIKINENKTGDFLQANKEDCKTYVRDKLKVKLDSDNEGKKSREVVEAVIMNSDNSIAKNSCPIKSDQLNASMSSIVGDKGILKTYEKRKPQGVSTTKITPGNIISIIPIAMPLAMQGQNVRTKSSLLRTISSDESLDTSSPCALTFPRKTEQQSSAIKSAALKLTNKNEEESPSKCKIPRISQGNEEANASSSKTPTILLKNEEGGDSKPKKFKILNINKTGNVSKLEIPRTSKKNDNVSALSSITPKLLFKNKVESDSKPKTLKILKINKNGTNSKPKILKILQINNDGNNSQPKTLKILQIRKEGSVSNFKVPRISCQGEGENPSTSTTLPVLHENAEKHTLNSRTQGNSRDKKVDDTTPNSRECQDNIQQTVDVTPVPLLLPDKIEEVCKATCISPMPVDLLTSKSPKCLNTKLQHVGSSSSKSMDNNIEVSTLESHLQTSIDTSEEKSHAKSNNKETNVSELSPKILHKNKKITVTEIKLQKPSNKNKNIIALESESAKSVCEKKKIIASELKSPSDSNKNETVLVSDLELDLTPNKKETVHVSDLKSDLALNKKETVHVSDLELDLTPNKIETEKETNVSELSPKILYKNKKITVTKLKLQKPSIKNKRIIALESESAKSVCEKKKIIASELKSPSDSNKNETVLVSDLELDLTPNKKETVHVSDLKSDLALNKKETVHVSDLELDLTPNKKETVHVSDLELDLTSNKKETVHVSDLESNLAPNKKETVLVSNLESPKSPKKKEKVIVSKSESLKSPSLKENVMVSNLESPKSPNQKEQVIDGELEPPKSQSLKEKVIISDLESPKSPNNEVEDVAADLESPMFQDENGEAIALDLKSPLVPRTNEEIIASQSTQSSDTNEEIIASQFETTQSPDTNEEIIASQLESPQFPDTNEEIISSQFESTQSPDTNEEIIASQLESRQFPDTNEEIISSQFESTQSPDTNEEIIASQLESPQFPDTNEEIISSQFESTQSPDTNEEIIASQLESPQFPDTNEEIISSQFESTQSPDTNEEIIASQLESRQFPDTNEEIISSQFESTQSPDTNEEIIASQLESRQFPDTNEEIISSQFESTQSPDTNEEIIVSQLESPQFPDTNEEIISSQFESTQSPDTNEETIALQLEPPQYSLKEKVKVCTSELPMSVDEKEEITDSKPLADEYPTTRNKSIDYADVKIPSIIINNSNVENIEISFKNDSSNVEAMGVKIEPEASVPDARDSPSVEPPIRRKRGRPKKVILPILEDHTEANFEKKEILGIKSTADMPSTQSPPDKSSTTTGNNTNVENMDISLSNDSLIIEPMEFMKSLSAPSISNANDSPPKEPPVPKKRGRPRKVVLPVSENESEQKLEKEETLGIESTADTPVPDNPLVNSCRTKRPPPRPADETDGKGLSEESEDNDGNDQSEESDDNNDKLDVLPAKRRGRPPGMISKGWTGGKRRRGARRRRGGRVRGRGGAANDSDYIPRLASEPDNKNKEEENCVQSEESKDNIPIVSEIECAKCKTQLLKKQWVSHNLSVHNGMGWINGTEEPDFENDIKMFRSVLMATLRRKTSLICETCGDAKRSANGFISHLQFCGKSDEERVSLLVTCPVCKNVMMPSSVEVHERTHRQIVKSENERKWEEVINPQDPSTSTSRGKRKAAEKAATNITKFTELVKDDVEEPKKSNDDELDKMIKKPRCPKNPPNIWKGIWKNELQANKKAFCRQPGCQFTGNSFEVMHEHNAVCPFTPIAMFVCKICNFSSPTEQTVNDHVQDNHWDCIPDSGSDRKEDGSSSEGCSDGEYEKEPKSYLPKKEIDRYRPQSTGVKYLDSETPIHPKWPVCYPPAIRWTMEFELKNYRMRLFENLSPSYMNLMNYEKSLEYLPELSRSIRVKLPGKGSKKNPTEWVRWDRFKGRVIKGVPSFFTGGPVWALAWLPIPAPMYNLKVNQYVAISTHPSMESDYTVGKSYTGKNMIQIWNIGHLDHSKKADLRAPEFAYGVTHDKGTIWCLDWCPSGCYEHEKIPDSYTNKTLNKEKNIKRMGLLAAACSDGSVHIFSLPFPEDLNFVRNENDPPDYCPIYDTKPVLTLTLSGSVYTNGEQNWQCTCLNWSKHLGHDTIIAGFSNGYVVLWDLKTTSPFLIYSKGETTIIEAFHSLYAHDHAVTSVQMIPFGGNRFFYTTGYDRLTQLWDMEDLSSPVDITKRGIITTGALLSHWNALVTACDDAYGLSNTHSYLVSLRQKGPKVVAVLPTKSTIYGMGTSDYGNSISQGTVAGEVLVMFPHQLWSFKDMDRDVPKKRWLASVTRIYDFKGSEKLKSVKTGVKRTTMDKEYVYKPETYNACDEQYGICFQDELTRSEHDIRARHPKQSCTNRLSSFNIEQYPFASVNRVSWNPNAWSYLWLCTGYQNGFVRLLNFNAVALHKKLNSGLLSHAKSMLGKETLETNSGEDVVMASQIDNQAES